MHTFVKFDDDTKRNVRIHNLKKIKNIPMTYAKHQSSKGTFGEDFYFPWPKGSSSDKPVTLGKLYGNAHNVLAEFTAEQLENENLIEATGMSKGLFVYEVDFPSNASVIGTNAFKNMNLVNIIIPGQIKTIKENAFYNKGTLKNVTLEEGVERIERYAFGLSFNIESINVPSTIKYIGYQALGSLNSLQNSIIIPNEVDFYNTEVVDTSAFSQWDVNGNGVYLCYRKPFRLYSSSGGAGFLHDLDENGKCKVCGYQIEQGYVLNKNGRLFAEIRPEDYINATWGGSFLELNYSITSLGTLSLPDGVTVLRTQTASGPSYAKLILPESITTFETDCLYNCHNLTEVNIPKNVTEIPLGGIYYCPKLTKLIFDDPNGWTLIDDKGNETNLSAATLSNPEATANILKNNYQTRYRWIKHV